jgi:excisionase family DNA binding protein
MQLFTVSEAAKRLSMHPETVRAYLRSGAIRGVKTGRAWKVEETEIAAYVERNRVAQQGDPK